ncbi:MAG: hypothetical protein QNI99_02300 [Woeseiaceae bacterium]|nr:hypothetical protein [Woeseiaceae bacterium]
MQQDNKNESPSFFKELVTGIVDDQKKALRFGLGGAVVGGIAGTALGIFLFNSFGLTGVGVCLLGGAVIGFVAAWFLYLSF